MSPQILPPDARPREKLLQRGPQALSDSELLAIVLRTGTAQQPVLSYAQGLLDRFQGLARLMHASAQALMQTPGLGPAKSAEILAIRALAMRALEESLGSRPVFEHPRAVKDYVGMHLRQLEREVFAVLFLDHHHRMLTLQTLFTGTLTQASVHPREVVKSALAHNAAAVLLCHNHPSGVAEPSRADEAITRTLQAALKLVDVRVLDHLIVGQDEVSSMAEMGLLG